MKHALCYSIFILLCFTACRPDPVCRSNMKVGLVAELEEIQYDATHQPHTNTTWDSITVQGIGNDSILYDNSKSIKKICLPLRHDADSTAYTLIYKGQTDTLLIIHNSRQHFVSVECGCVYNHTVSDLQCTRHWVDSITVLSDNVERGGETNIRFYRENQ